MVDWDPAFWNQLESIYWGSKWCILALTPFYSTMSAFIVLYTQCMMVKS